MAFQLQWDQELILLIPALVSKNVIRKIVVACSLILSPFIPPTYEYMMILSKARFAKKKLPM